MAKGRGKDEGKTVSVQLGRDLRALRKTCGMSQYELAEATGLPQSYLSTIERGQANPTVRLLTLISNQLGADLVIVRREPVNPDDSQ